MSRDILKSRKVRVQKNSKNPSFATFNFGVSSATRETLPKLSKTPSSKRPTSCPKLGEKRIGVSFSPS